jgi:4-amino-4-deoxy-L-arabinose transferase-like glycosyltransferase
MASYAIFGDHDWAARVPTSVLTSLMIFALWAFVRRRIPERALYAALITASCIFVVAFGRAASTDMPLTACFTIGMLAWMEWFLSGRRAWLLVFYAFQALGMLAKGPVSPFLAGLVIVVFALLWIPEPRAGTQKPDAEKREPRAGSRVQLITSTLWWPGILLFLVIALPWYIAVQLKTGNFFRVFILEHNLARFGTNLYRHHQPFWYYIPVLLVGLLPWAVIFVAEFVRTIRNFRAWSADRPLMILVFVWCVVPVIFFSLSQSKLPGYILPAFPAAILMVVHYLHERPDAKLPLPLLLAHALCCGTVLALVLVAPHLLLRVRPGSAAITYSLAAGAAIILLVSFLIYRHGLRIAAAITLVPIIVAVAFVVKAAAPAVDVMQSARPLARELQQLDRRAEHAHGRVVLYHLPRPLDYGLHYYIRGAYTMEDPFDAMGSAHLFVTPRGIQLPPEFSGVLVEQYAPPPLDIYYQKSRVPPKAVPQADRVH